MWHHVHQQMTLYFTSTPHYNKLAPWKSSAACGAASGWTSTEQRSAEQDRGSFEVNAKWWSQCIMLRGCPAMYCFVSFSCTLQFGLPNWYFCIVVSHEMWAVFYHLLHTDTMPIGRGGQPSWRKNSPAVTWRYRQGEQHKQKAWDCHFFPCHNITWSVQE